MNVTEFPAQIVVALAAILTPAGVGEFTVIVIPLEVAGLPCTFGRLEVITQVTICPFVKVVVV